MRDHAEVVQHVLGGHRARRGCGRGPSPRRPAGRLEVVDRDDHVEVLGHRVPAEREGRVGRGADDVGHARHRQHVGYVAAAAALDVEGVDGAAVEHPQGVLTDRHSFSPSVCRATWTSCSSATRSAVSSARACAPMSSWTLNPHAPPSASASTSGAGSRGRARPRKPMLTGQASKAANAPRSAQGELTPDAPDRAELLADDRGDAGGERGLHDARGQQVDVGVDGAGGGDQPLAGDDRGAGADDHVDAVERVGVPGPPERADPALADADGHLADAQHRVDARRRC